MLLLLVGCLPVAYRGPVSSGDDSATNADSTVDSGTDSAQGADSSPVDADGDGYASVATGGDDCDDANADVHPGAAEACNGVDDDCNGAIDDILVHYDLDRDGYGDPAVTVTVLGCDLPAGLVTDATDCDDADATVFPGAVEVCNGVDDNCDGQVDEALDATFYADVDGDGYGDPTSTVVNCAAPSGYVADDTDCDDANATVYPGAPEACDGLDDNCDGLTTGACRRWLGDYGADDVDAQLSGLSGAWVATGDLDGDGAVDVATGDGYSDGNLGVSWIVGGVTRGSVLGEGDAFATVTGDVPLDQLGQVGGIPGDVTGDGQDDLVLGGATTTDLFAGPMSGAILPGDASSTFDRPSDPVALTSVAGLDNDGDGAPDLVLAYDAASDAHEKAGVVYVVTNPVPAGDLVPDRDAAAKVVGGGSSWYLGEDVSSAGDVDGDGVDDLWISAYGAQPNPTWPGAAYLMKGPLVGEYNAYDDADTVIYGSTGQVGSHVAGAGDLDGDGYADVVATGSNLALVYSGPPTAGWLSDADATAVISGLSEGAIETRADLDGDGKDDLVMGDASGGRYGEAHLFYGPVAGVLGSDDADANLGMGGYYDEFGAAMATGDVNGDGVDDLVIADPDSGVGYSTYFYFGGTR